MLKKILFVLVALVLVVALQPFTEPEGDTNSDFSFKPNGDQTEVAWARHGHHNFM
jgi:hypothetical protein